MGKTLTPKYAVEFFGVRLAGIPGRAIHWTPSAWHCKQSGRPTAANLAKYIKGYEDSTLPGGCNAHCGATTVGAARIVLNDGSHTSVAEYKAAW